MKAKLLYVEDDETLSFVTKDNLELNGYTIVHCLNGKDALEKFSQGGFDLCILDVMLPEMDGFSLAEAIRRKNQQIPILFLTAKSLKEDRLHGLRIGGDDYIVKPFSIEELILKIEIFLKRSKVIESPAARIRKIGVYEFDYTNFTLHNSGVVKKLTKREADLLKYLIDNKNKVIERGKILEAIWGENDYFLGRSLDVFISRLRKYLKADEAVKIENIHGVGFRMEY